MSNPGEADLTPITHRRQLADWFAAGSKPRADWGVGTEHEKFGFHRAGLATPEYEGPGGIRAILAGLQAKGWEPILDAGNPIGLKRGSASVSLEPAGQLELSGGILPDLHATWLELQEHLREVHEVTGPLGVGFAPLGFHPTHTRAEMPWMPKGRYAIMRRYMPTVGRLGLDMMQRTCTVQANLDYGDEADMVEKLRDLAGAAAGGDRAVRQFALHRGQAERLPQHARAGLDRHRRRPHRHPLGGVRAGLRLRALRRMAARHADVLRHAGGPVAGRGGAEFPRISSTASWMSCRASAPPWATSPTM